MRRSLARGWMRAAVRSPRLTYAGLGVFAVVVWWANVYTADVVIAMKGFSPIAWVYKTLHPADFAQDFPSGIENYRRSAFMYVYPAAYSLGISPEVLLPAVVAFEILLFSWALLVLCRALLPDAPPIVGALVVVLAIATSARDVNFAHWGQPFFIGQFYNVADALRIFGIVMVLRGRPLPAAALLAFSFAAHPTLGLMGLACAASMLLVRPRDILKARYLVAAAVFVLLAGGWAWLQYRSAAVRGGQIPVQDWIDMTRAFSYHWYPIDNGLLTTSPQLQLLPFLSVLILLAYYWPERSTRNEITGKALVGVLAMLGLTIAGLVISALVPVPFLIKLALHRSNDLVIIIALVYVVAGLWRDLQGDQWWRRAVAATALVALCRIRPAFPLLWSILLVSPAWLRVVRRRPASAADWTVTGLTVTGIALAVIYLSTGMAPALKPLDIAGPYGGLRGLLLLGGFLLVGAVFARWDGRRFVQGFAVAAVVALALAGLQYQTALHKVEDPAVARDYLQAQLWARDHTPSDALFMPDPTIYYGWRDYSRRSSFGNLREWLHTTWIYDSSFERYQEGMRRFKEFNIDIGQYLHAKPPLSTMRRLHNVVKQRYYTASDEWRLGLAQRYGIDYFVFRRKEMVNPSRLPMVYENQHIVIHAAGK